MVKLEIEWKAHADFERMLAEVFQDDPIEGIKELVANGFDADASRFDVLYRPDEEVLIAKDNGIGMGVYELRKGFYKSGDSLTKKIGKTKRGRTPMGSYGIGTIVMHFLARKYRLETWRDGQKLTVEEEFEEGKRPSKVLTAIQEDCNTNLHGTTITIDPIRFASGDVSIDQLVRRLVLGINVESRLEEGDRFEMYVNEQKVELKNPKPTLAFTVNKHDDLVGQVHGRVYFYHSVPPYRGIVLRVNGRQVGSESYFDDLLLTLMRGRVYAEIDVDSMVSRISFSRARFQEDSPHFQRLVNILEAAFKSYRGEVEGYIKQEILSRGETAVESALAQTSDLLGSVSNLVLPKLRLNSAKVSSKRTGRSRRCRETDTSESRKALGEVLLSTQTKEGYRLVLASDQVQSYGAIDPQTGILRVNISHPYFTLPGKFAEQPLQIQMLYALSEILGQREFNSVSSKYAALVAARNNAIWRLAKEVFGGQQKLEDALMREDIRLSKRGISPNRMYTSSELSHECQIDKVWLNKFQDAGLLRPTAFDDAGERYYGANLILTLDRLKGGTPAFQIVREYVDAERTDVTRQRRAQYVHAIDGELADMKTQLPYVFNISFTSSPLYIVMPGFEDNFKELYITGKLKNGNIAVQGSEALEAIAKKEYRNPAVGIEGTESWNFMDLVSRSNRHPSISVEQTATARTYNALDSYASGDIVLHESFGFGIVSDSKAKICDVKFKEGKITLAHNR